MLSLKNHLPSQGTVSHIYSLFRTISSYLRRFSRRRLHTQITYTYTKMNKKWQISLIRLFRLHCFENVATYFVSFAKDIFHVTIASNLLMLFWDTREAWKNFIVVKWFMLCTRDFISHFNRTSEVIQTKQSSLLMCLRPSLSRLSDSFTRGV